MRKGRLEMLLESEPQLLVYGAWEAGQAVSGGCFTETLSLLAL